MTGKKELRVFLLEAGVGLGVHGPGPEVPSVRLSMTEGRGEIVGLRVSDTERQLLVPESARLPDVIYMARNIVAPVGDGVEWIKQGDLETEVFPRWAEGINRICQRQISPIYEQVNALAEKAFWAVSMAMVVKTGLMGPEYGSKINFPDIRPLLDPPALLGLGVMAATVLLGLAMQRKAAQEQVAAYDSIDANLKRAVLQDFASWVNSGLANQDEEKVKER